MFSTDLSRRSAGLLIMASVALSQACFTYQRPRVGLIEPGSSMRVKSSAPFVISASSAGGNGDCRATLAEGVVNVHAGDTVGFRHFTRVVPAERGDQRCSSLATGTLVLPADAGAELTVQRLSRTRTTILLVSAAAVGLFIAAASSIELMGSCGSYCSLWVFP